MASTPQLARALAEHAENPGMAPMEDQIQILSLYRAIFLIWSNAHRQHLNRTIDPAVSESVVQELTAYAGETPPGIDVKDIQRRQKITRWAWSRERFLDNTDFQAFVDERLALE